MMVIHIIILTYTDNSGIAELKYYIVELMKDQNEIRQIVKDLRDILEEQSDD